MNKYRQPILCLASASPRRRELLIQLGCQVQVQPIVMDESRQKDEPPADYCVRLALAKNRLAVSQFNPALPVISADTIVVLDNETLGKPKDKKTVVATLQRLSGVEHQVMTAIAVYHHGEMIHDIQISRVQFAELDESWISAYANTEEPYDKAGAYGIQGTAGRWIETITGSYSGIMGLPLFETARLLTKLDIMSDKTL